MSDISAHGEWEGTEEHGLNEGESSQRSPTGPHENVISPIIPHLGLLNVSTGLPGPALIDHSPLQRMPSRGPDHDTESEESDSVPSIEATTVHAALALFSAYEGDKTNFPVQVFLSLWRSDIWRSHSTRRRCRIPPLHAPDIPIIPNRPEKVTPSLMRSSGCDEQGINWTKFSVTKQDARAVRKMTYKNLANVIHGHEQAHRDLATPKYIIDFTDGTTQKRRNNTTFFDFHETHTLHEPQHPHYQLRHNLVAYSQNAVIYNKQSCKPYFDISYANDFSVMCYDPVSSSARTCLAKQRICPPNPIEKVSCIAAKHDILIAGSMSGTYAMRRLSRPPNEPFVTGSILTASPTSILSQLDSSTNHVDVITCRHSNRPQAIVSSNDRHVRILDCGRNTWTAGHPYPTAINCSATSSDHRLRLLVLDDCQPLLVDAETGQTLTSLSGHVDHGFACAWSQSDRYAATGHQDGIVQIWDSRNFRQSLARIPCEQAGARSMTFAPASAGGPEVLCFAESADFVHLIDPARLQHMQTLEFFGEIGGISVTPDGNSLWIANDDQGFGGLMEFHREQKANILVL